MPVRRSWRSPVRPPGCSSGVRGRNRTKNRHIADTPKLAASTPTDAAGPDHAATSPAHSGPRTPAAAAVAFNRPLASVSRPVPTRERTTVT